MKSKEVTSAAGSGKVPGQGPGQGPGQVPFVMREVRVLGRFTARFQGGSKEVPCGFWGGPWQERTENDLVGDRESWTVPLVNQ